MPDSKEGGGEMACSLVKCGHDSSSRSRLVV